MQDLRCCNIPLVMIIHCNKVRKNVKQTPNAKIEGNAYHTNKQHVTASDVPHVLILKNTICDHNLMI